MDTGLSELLRTCVFIRKEMGPAVSHTPPPTRRLLFLSLYHSVKQVFFLLTLVWLLL